MKANRMVQQRRRAARRIADLMGLTEIPLSGRVEFSIASSKQNRHAVVTRPLSLALYKRFNGHDLQYGMETSLTVDRA